MPGRTRAADRLGLAARLGIAVAGVSVIGAGVLSGCTSSSGAAGSSSRTASVTTTSVAAAASTTGSTTGSATTLPPTTSAPTTAATASAAATSSTAATTTSPVASTSNRVTVPSPTSPAHVPLCTASALTFTALRGSGAMQQQYATISAHNKAASGCWIVGYAHVTLLLGGKPLGRPAEPAQAGQPATYVAAGHTATASLHGPSTCQAGVSDHVRIAAPGQASATTVELPMRGCGLVIDALRTR